MSGPLIALTTVIVIFGFVWIIMIADKLLAWVAQQFREGSVLKKILLLIPLVLLLIFSTFTWILAIGLGLFALYTVATGTRNWWHKGR